MLPSNCSGNEKKIQAIRNLLRLLDMLQGRKVYRALGHQAGNSKIIVG